MEPAYSDAKAADAAELGAARGAPPHASEEACSGTARAAAREAEDAEFRRLAEAAIAARARGDTGPHWLAKAAQKAASYTSFAPMVLAAALPDPRAAALAAAAVALANLGLSALLVWCRVQKIFPKIFDLVNVLIYVTIAVLALTHPALTRLWMPFFTSGLTGTYFLASLLMRRPFALELAKESADEAAWASPAFGALMWRVSAAWTLGIWVNALAALAFAVLYMTSGPNPTAYLVLDVILGIAPLVAAVVAQHALVRRFRRRVAAAADALLAERGSGGGGGDDGGKAAGAEQQQRQATHTGEDAA
ncbi:MAG: hypothetical protein J3K34DRAFT_521138 [Monoraphidium minutum]|nr:MAG: hypothetical protein J3K34DRAFT_521138 [Monoraphidium minutum]